MNQKVEYIDLEKLVLWTENPREPINPDATDQDIVDKALEDKLSKWSLPKLAKEMGNYYDFSELPTVVYHDKKPVVYDGNRRIILGKIKHKLVDIPGNTNIQLPEFPKEIPCNVCTKKIALNNVYRKHSETGSWLPLERDLFLNKFMGKEKSTFLAIDEHTGIISANPHLNQRFVKDEIFKDEILKSIGFIILDGKLHSVHTKEEGYAILNDISQKIEQKDITTRKNRGKVIEVLNPESQRLIDENKKKKPKPYEIKQQKYTEPKEKKRLTRRMHPQKAQLFGGKLYLRMGEVSDLYRDIVDLHKFYTDEKDTLSKNFPNIIRMALRLLCETAAKSKQMKLENYLSRHYDDAKETFNKDIRTTLSNLNITKNSITQLLHTGAHTYTSSSNIEQTMALSIAVGAIITITHGTTE